MKKFLFTKFYNEFLKAFLVLFFAIIPFFYFIYENKYTLDADFISSRAPKHLYVLENLKKGNIPLWNPYLNNGHPVVHDIQFYVFYPLNLLILPFIKANTYQNLDYNVSILEIFTIFHLWLGALFMFILLFYYFRISFYSSFFGASIFGINGFFISHLIHPNIIYSGIWLPLIFLFFDRSLKSKNNRFLNIFFTSLFMTISIFGGHPQIVYYIFLFLGIYAVLYALFDVEASKRKYLTFIKNIWIFIGFCVLTFGFSAVQMLPFIEYANFSWRGDLNFFQSLFFSGTYSYNPKQFLSEIFNPNYFGSNSFYFPSASCCPWEYKYYIGLLPLILLLYYFFLKKDLKNSSKKIKIFYLLIFLFLLLSFGKYTILFFIFSIVPGFIKFRAHARFLYLVVFLNIIIFSLIIDFLLKKSSKYIFKKVSLATLIMMILFFIITGFNFLNFQFRDFIYFKKYIFIQDLISLILLLLILFIFYFAYKGFVNKKILILLIFFVIYSDLSFKIKDFSIIDLTPKQYYNVPQKVRKIFKESKKEDTRIFFPERYLNFKPNSALIYKFKTLNNHNILITKETSNFLSRLYSCSFKDFNNPCFNFLKVSNVKYVIIPNILMEEFYDREKLNDYLYKKYKNFPNRVGVLFLDNKNYKIIELKDALPYYMLFYNYVILDKKGVLDYINRKNFDFKKEVILSSNFENNITLKYSPQDKIVLLNSKPTYKKFYFDIKNGTILYIAENFYPGWDAYLNNKKIKIIKANYMYMAVYIPKGKGELVLKFEPDSFKIGRNISFFTLLVLITGIIISRIKINFKKFKK